VGENLDEAAQLAGEALDVLARSRRFEDDDLAELRKLVRKYR
jgi:hypothetical protein